MGCYQKEGNSLGVLLLFRKPLPLNGLRSIWIMWAATLLVELRMGVAALPLDVIRAIRGLSSTLG